MQQYPPLIEDKPILTQSETQNQTTKPHIIQDTESIFNLNRSKQLADKLDVLSQSIVREPCGRADFNFLRSLELSVESSDAVIEPMHLCGLHARKQIYRRCIRAGFTNTFSWSWKVVLVCVMHRNTLTSCAVITLLLHNIDVRSYVPYLF